MVDCHIDIQIEQAPSCYLVQTDMIAKLMAHMLQSLSLEAWELSLSFVSDIEMQKINAQHRNRNQSTDVLSFPQQMWKTPLHFGEKNVHSKKEEVDSFYSKPLGDIIISLERAEQNAQEIDHGLDREICFLLIHGLLHLCGHDHERPEEEAIMCEQQQKILLELQGKDPVPWLNMVTRKKDSP